MEILQLLKMKISEIFKMHLHCLHLEEMLNGRIDVPKEPRCNLRHGGFMWNKKCGHKKAI